MPADAPADRNRITAGRCSRGVHVSGAGTTAEPARPMSRRRRRSFEAYYAYGCKRPTFHDEYLPTFNLPHVTLVDTAPTGVADQRNGVVHNGVEIRWTC